MILEHFFAVFSNCRFLRFGYRNQPANFAAIMQYYRNRIAMKKSNCSRVVIINQDLTIISHSHNDLIIVTMNCVHLDRALEADALISWLFETC